MIADARPPVRAAPGSAWPGRLSRLLLVAVLVSGFCALSPSAARATDDESPRSSPMTSLLCSSKRVPCAVQVGRGVREGTAAGVYVTGRPSATVDVRVFRLQVVGSRITGMKPLTDPARIEIDDRGRGRGQVVIEPFGVDGSGGWALVTLADATWTGEPRKIVGQIVPLHARVPSVLGDGYGTRKPVGAPLDLEIANYLAGTQFVVEYLGDDEGWHDVTRGTEEREEQGQSVMTVRYAVPNGLVARPYRFRVHNLSDPSAADPEWVVVPSAEASELERAPLLSPPELGTGVSGTLVTTVYSTKGTIVIATILVVLGVLVVLIGPAVAIRRRRVDGWLAT